jgi:hypothetical protein
MHLFVQTVAACPSGQLVFRDIWPCRLVVAGEERHLYVAAAFEASGRMREVELGRVGGWKAECLGECED